MTKNSFSPYLASLLIALPLASSAFAPAEQAPKNKKPSTEQDGLVLHMMVRRIPLDIVVTDKQGNPVKNLRKEDFTVTEDKKEQRILSFEYVNSAQAFTPPKLPPLPPNTFVNLPPSLSADPSTSSTTTW